MTSRTFFVYGFASTHDALAAETALKASSVTFRIVPSPAGIGELCGIAVRVPVDEAGDAERTLRVASCSWEARIETLDT